MASAFDEAQGVGLTEEEADRLAKEAAQATVNEGCSADFPPAQAPRTAKQTSRRRSPEKASKPQTRSPRFLTRNEARNLSISGYIVQGMIPKRGVGQIYGDSGCGKSFTMMSLVHHIAEGHDFCGRKTRQRPVYYFHLEGVGGLPKRLAAFDRWLAEESNWPALGDNLHYWIDPFDLTPAGVEQAVATIIGNGDSGALVVIDTQTAALAGTKESATEEMSAKLKLIRSFARRINGVVLLIHHSGKNPEMGARGSSTQRADFDFQFEAKKDGDTILWRTTKERDEDDSQSIRFKLKVFPDLVQDEDGEWQSSCVAVPETDLPEDERKTLKAVTTKAKGRRMSDRTRNALRVFDEAIHKHGKAGRMHESVFREAFLAKVPVDTSKAKDPNGSKRKAYNRELEKLVALKIIELDGEWLRYSPEYIASEQ